MPTAVVIDGAFFLRRLKYSFPNINARDPDDVALAVTSLTAWHLAFRLTLKAVLNAIERSGFRPEESEHLYRVFFYDCAPLTKKVHYPVSKTALNLERTETARFRLAVHERLQTVRKVAVRLGRLNDEVLWRHKPEAMRKWLNDPGGYVATDNDFDFAVVQKGVDMRLGLDVASMAFKKQVDQIILVAADADFVPAAKLARREGIDVVLDPMGFRAADDLVQHCDGVRSCRIEGRPGVGRKTG